MLKSFPYDKTQFFIIIILITMASNFYSSIFADDTPACITLDGDVNYNGVVDLEDLEKLTAQWLSQGINPDNADINQNGKVDLGDYYLIADNWLNSDNGVVINEFMTLNSYIPFVSQQEYSTIVNGDSTHPDWLELHNRNSQEAVNLHGWYLTDDPKNLTKWQIPEITINPDGFQTFAATKRTFEEFPDNYPFIDDSGIYHTNFNLSDKGQYLALVKPDGQTISWAYEAKYPKQYGMISYGIGSNDCIGYLKAATPNTPNSDIFDGAVGDTSFSVDRGFFNEPIDIEITCPTEGATIKYTLDGSMPTEDNGTIYAEIGQISGTTVLRARAFKDGFLPSNTDTQTYIFPNDVITQIANGVAPAGWPSGSINGQVFNYGMDPDITESSEYGPLIIEAMKAIPTISLVTNLDNLFNSGYGIYVNAYQDGIDWERPVSVEMINPDGSKGFQVDGGIRIRGGYSRAGSNPKHSFRLLFKGGYGDTKLEYTMFEDSKVNEFDNIDLRTAQNYAWSNWGNDGSRNSFVRDVFSRDLQLQQSQPSTHSIYCHLYINGQYWGLYQTQERSEASYAASYFGGRSEDYDVIKVEAGSYTVAATDGTINKWNELWNLAQEGFETNAKYYAVQGKGPDGIDNPLLEAHVDIDNLIDYMLVVLYAGNQDAPVTLSGTGANNFYAVRNRNAQVRQGWQFFAHDSEHSMLSPNIDRTITVSAGNTQNKFNPQWLHQMMMANAEYRLKFADRAHIYLFNEGIMTTEKAQELLMSRAAEIDLAIIAESARWGDQRNDRVDNPYTKAHWWAEVNGFLKNSYLQNRTSILLGQLKNKSLYPQIDAPVFNQHGGNVENGFKLTMTDNDENGIVYYTLNGSDPRIIEGGINPDAMIYKSGVDSQQEIIARGASWKYLDDGSDQGTAWQQLSFNDNNWQQGNAELGYGDGTETTVVGYIDVSTADGIQKNATTYFRKKFTVSNKNNIIALALKLRRDDGAILYLNGNEIRRDNMPDGIISYDTYAGINFVVGGADESTYFDSDIDPSHLVDGENVIAVEIHQTHDGSSDISFDLELIATIDGSGSETQILMDSSVQVKARVLFNESWSAINQATFAVGPVAENLRISEIMYHPANEPEAEFIELTNIGIETINLNMVKFTNGIDFTFGDMYLQPNDYIIITNDLTTFNNTYIDFNGIIAGTYSGSLSNSGEKITLIDAIGTAIQKFGYNDSWFDVTDGDGFSLSVIDANANNDLNEKSSWRPSSIVGGSPGAKDNSVVPAPGAIVISEILAHSHAQSPDWIELYNTTNTPINIGGWYLSDNNSTDEMLKKYKISNGTIIPANGYLVFHEHLHFGTSFALSENGETVYLTSASDGQLTSYRIDEDFGASPTDVSFGRYYKASTDSYNFVLMSANTPGVANAYPKVGPVVISEIMYGPAGNKDAEYVELLNISSQPVSLYDSLANKGWMFCDDGGIEFNFPIDTTIAVGEKILLVKDLTAFNSEFDAPDNTQIYQWTDGSLSNAGEKIQLSMPGDVNNSGIRQYIRIDRVVYSDGSHPTGQDPWPTEADGNGKALIRIDNETYGNDIVNWQAENPSPGL
ncbi:MAG: lamin tail domain-containing protein [Phycisphaerae bacterium]|nr:lamin tail domain-containing protein [Phycisphaerae bacterium]